MNFVSMQKMCSLSEKISNLAAAHLLKVAVIFLLLTSSVLLVAASNGYPIAVGDKQWFYPVIYSIKHLNQLSHPFLSPITSDNNNYVWHGFLFPILQSLFVYHDDYSKIEFSSVIIWILNCLLFIKIIKITGIKSFAIFIISAAIFNYQMGRPELFVSTVLLIDYCLEKEGYHERSPIFTSFISATLLAISPVSFIIYFFFTLAKIEDIKKASNLKNPIYYILTPLFVYVYFILTVNDFTFSAWMKGIYAHSKVVTAAKSSNVYEGYLFGNLFLPFLFVGYLGCLISLMLNIKTKAQFCLTALFIFVAYWLSIRTALRIYNTIPFMPFILIYSRKHENVLSKINFIIILFLAFYCAKGITLNKTRDMLITIGKGNSFIFLEESIKEVELNKTIQLPSEFYIYGINHPHLILDKEVALKGSNYSADVLYFSQVSVGYLTESTIPQVDGYCLKEKKVNLNSQVLYDWSYLKYEKCA